MASVGHSGSHLIAKDFLIEIGGMPFLDPAFRPSTLLAAVATVRRRADPTAFSTLSEYLYPDNAATIFEKYASSPVTQIASTDLSSEQVEIVEESHARIVRTIPEWSALLGIPVRYRKMCEDSISATNILVPQAIYLGERAFTTVLFPLEETLVHEHAHIWLNFIAEVFNLEKDDSPRDFVLPSGTSGKTLRGVLFAAHFAAAAIAFYARLGTRASPLDARMAYLGDYLGSCLEMTERHPSFTQMGTMIWRRLSEYHRNLDLVV